jgi:N-carbamoyl-L-amino-acid hydrolase
VTVDTRRFLADLYDLRKIGTYKTGVHRPTYSPEDMESRRWLMARLAEIGLEPTMDGIGNVIGRHQGPGPHLLVGSHIETQNHAGWLDGALGVVAGLALARAGLPVDVIALADEEGHYASFPGSRSFIGILTEEDIDRAANRYHQKPLRTALKEAGLEGVPRVQYEPGRYKGFLELHIEQGTQLENAGLRAGIVTGIVAIRQWKLTFTGMQDHAGGTTMEERRDAGLSAVRLLAMIDHDFPRVRGPRSTWTAGRITLDPGAASIIPGKAEVLFQLRDVDNEVIARMEERLRALVLESNRREKCPCLLEPVSLSVPALCDAAMQQALADAAESLAPGLWQRMPSGAGHDAQYLARVMPAAMLFCPSINGISHHWAEDTRDEDLALAVEILAEGARRILAA